MQTSRVSFRLTVAFVLAIACVLLLHPARAQQGSTASPITLQTVYQMANVNATGASSAQVTLTIPAPAPSFFNYVCSVHFNASHDNTATTATTNGVTTSTNFNAYALKFSLNNVANQNYDWYDSFSIANVGCAKSSAAGTATTFVSPTATANTQFTWEATYYQAP